MTEFGLTVPASVIDDLAERVAARVLERLGTPAGEQPEPWCLLNLEQAAQRLGRSPRWIRERVKCGELPQVRLDGGALAFDLDDLRAFARSRRVPGEARDPQGEWWEAAA
jgi:predicted DNA-binding transcriptional regulator AlpA